MKGAALANQVWTDVNGDWANGTLWGPSPGAPTASDSATLGGLAAYQVSVGGTSPASEDVSDLLLTDTHATLDIMAGSTLAVGGALTNDGRVFVASGATLEVAADGFVNSGQIIFAPGAELLVNAGSGFTTGQLATLLTSIDGDGATIVVTGTVNNAGAAIDLASAPFANVSFDVAADIIGGALDTEGGILSGSPTLDGVSVAGPILLNTAGQNLTIVDAPAVGKLGSGLTFDGPGAALSLGDTEVLNDVTIAVGTDTAGVDAIFGDFSDSVTFGNSALISVASHPTAVSGAPNELLIDDFSTVLNQGTFSVGQNGPSFLDIFAVTQFVNTGTLAIGPGATFSAGGDSIIDTGPILIGTGGFFGVGATLTTTQLNNLFDQISGGPGTIGFDGVLDNSGDVLNLASVPGSVSIGGVIAGGTVSAPPNATPIVVGFSGSLTDLTYQGALNLPVTDTDLTLDNVRFTGAGGSGLGTIEVGSSFEILSVTQGALDEVVVQVGGSPFEISGGNALVLGRNFSVSSPGEVDIVADTLFNAGTLLAPGASDALMLVGDTLVNTGTIAVAAGGTFSVGQAGGSTPLSIVNGGMIGIGAGGTVIVGDLETTEQLLALLGTLVTPGSLTVDLVGTLINTGATLDVGSSPLIGKLLLSGSIIGGVTSGTIVNQGGTIEGVEEVGSAAPCFCAGTRIMTAQGPRPVEMLRVGDRVQTRSGALVPIIWIGQRQVDLLRHPHPDQVRPVRICAHAFAPQIPQRDLLLSPDHAVFVADATASGGVLIPARYLVNGATVLDEIGCRRAHYFHIELPVHDVLLAEGLRTESYLDTGNRDQFAQASVPALHPDFAPRFWTDSCAPLCLSGPEVTRVRRTLLDRAGALGYRQHQASLSLRAGSRRLMPAATRRDVISFLVPAQTHTVQLVSAVSVPAHMQAQSQDRRALGVAVGGVLVNGRAFLLDGPAFGEGFYPFEAGWRWTNGDACLILPASERSAPMLLELFITEFATIWAFPQQPSDILSA